MAQVSILDGAMLEHRGFWVALLPQGGSTATLPFDRPRAAVSRIRPASSTVVFHDALAARLAKLTKGSAFLLYTAVLTGVQIVLHRYGANGPIVTGSPPLKRDNGDAGPANAVPVALEVTGAQEFKDLLVALRARLIEAYSHQDYPSSRLINDLGLGEVKNRCPLFDVAVAYPEIHGPMSEAGNDLTITLTGNTQSLTAELTYDSRLFNADTVARFAGHLMTILDAALDDMTRPVDRLPLTTEAEARQDASWNDTRNEALRTMDLVAMVEAQATAKPDATAVEFADERITYDALNRRANRMAHWLRANSVGPDSVVGLCIERSISMVEAILGIAKAGAAVLPLDPGYPHERLGFMVEDGQATLLLVQEDLLDHLPPLAAGRIVTVDTAHGEMAEVPDTNPDPIAGPENLLYVLYTSGSTGLPKGVAMVRRAIGNLVAWQIGGGDDAEGTRTLQFASLNFDVSFQEIFSTLCRGGVLVMIPEALRRDRRAFARVVAERGIARLFLPVVALKELAKAVEETGVVPTHLREIITAGEQLQLNDAIVGMLRQIGDCTLHNQYGPTETHVVTAYGMSGAPSRWPVLPPIGRPVDNCRIHIVDRHLQAVPAGVVGELYIAGDCLALGYWARPDMTAERFVPDPFAEDRGCRMYRTGDLARRLPDGTIEFLGRADDQVKIRGYRVELGEIEVALGQHEAIKDAVVLTDGDGGSDQVQLVAYVVPGAGRQVEASDLRSFLESRLPAFMIPNHFLMLDAFPLTPSGKVDRRSLPALKAVQLPAQTEYTGPRDDIEERLARIWADVLGAEQVSIHDNFFLLGGHSLLVAQIIARVRQAFDYDMPVHVMFDTPTVADMANRIRGEAGSGSDVEFEQLVADLEHLPKEELDRLLADQG